VNDGLTAYVPVTVTCHETGVLFSNVGVEVRQAQDGAIASGFGAADNGVLCTGQPETVVVTVEAYGPGPALAVGRAYATAYVDIEAGDPAQPVSTADRLADQVVELTVPEAAPL
jgi:hypothetical protein